MHISKIGSIITDNIEEGNANKYVISISIELKTIHDNLDAIFNRLNNLEAFIADKQMIAVYDNKEGKMIENVNHPTHYGGKDSLYETVKVIEAWGLTYNTGNAVKYISRAGKKDPAKHIEDLEKAVWYISREIENLKNGKK